MESRLTFEREITLHYLEEAALDWLGARAVLDATSEPYAAHYQTEQSTYNRIDTLLHDLSVLDLELYGNT